MLRGVGQVDAELGPVAEVASKRGGQMLDGEHDLVDAVMLKQAHRVLDHGPSHDGEERLGHSRRQGAQAAAEAAGHDHRSHGEGLPTMVPEATMRRVWSR